MKQIIWSDKADADFDDAYAYALSLGTDHAAGLLDLLDETQLLLGKHPQAGTTINQRGFRKWLLKPLACELLYEVTPDAVLIVRLIHLRSNRRPLA